MSAVQMANIVVLVLILAALIAWPISGYLLRRKVKREGLLP